MGRGSSGIGSSGTGGGKTQLSGQGWKEDYNRAREAEKQYEERAHAMDADVKAAKDAYYAAPQRSKAQKAEAERLRQEMNNIGMQQQMLLYRAAQAASFAENLRMENDPAYRKKKDKQAARNARLNYR